MQCQILSTMERLVGAMLGMDLDKLEPEVQEQISNSLGDKDVLKMSTVDKAWNERLKHSIQAIRNRIEVERWLADNEKRFEEIWNGGTFYYKIQTFRTAIPRMRGWKLLIRTPLDRPRHMGFVFYRSGLWILSLIHDADIPEETVIYRIERLSELKEILLKGNKESAERFKESHRDLTRIPTEMEDSETDPVNPEIKQWLVQGGQADLMYRREKILFYKGVGCNWQFRIKLPEYQTLWGVVVFKSDSKIDIWYDAVIVDQGSHWFLRGYIQDIHEEELKQIDKRSLEEWIRAAEPLYYAKNAQNPEVEWTK